MMIFEERTISRLHQGVRNVLLASLKDMEEMEHFLIS